MLIKIILNFNLLDYKYHQFFKFNKIDSNFNKLIYIYLQTVFKKQYENIFSIIETIGNQSL